MSSSRRLAVGMVLAMLLGGTLVATAASPANAPFQRTWQRTDLPVATGQAHRTWMWGPDAFTGALTEPYAESPNGERTVQYFDKARMEITHPSAVDDGLWYVTNGLLATELITGRVQLGNDLFEERSSANIPVGGDADNISGPTYATFAGLLDAPATPAGWLVTVRVDRAGITHDDPNLASRSVTVTVADEVTGHSVALPFWTFMTSSGTVYESGSFTWAPLFENPYFATGRPITEPYWASAKVAGTQRDVLIQCFERRCLTYTPDNEPEWQVEAGNVGQHYYAWRHDETGEPDQPPPVDLTPTPTPVSEPPTPSPAPETPTPSPPPHSAPLIEPIYSPEWLEPYWPVHTAFSPLGDSSIFAPRATEIAGLYNLVTADLGYWNHDTRGFSDWLQDYAASYYTADGVEYRRQLYEHAYAQMMIGIYQPDTNLGQRIRLFEADIEDEQPGSGPQLYWDLLVGPAWWLAVFPMPEHTETYFAHEHFWEDIVPRYEAVQSKDPTIRDFGAYLASRYYSIDRPFFSR